MGGGMGGHVARPQKCGSGRDSRRQGYVRVNPGIEQDFPGPDRAEWVADNHRDDGGLAEADVVSHGFEFRPHSLADFGQSFHPLRLLLKNVQAGEYGGPVGWRQTGAEDKGPREMLDPMDGLLRSGDESPDGR